MGSQYSVARLCPLLVSFSASHMLLSKYCMCTTSKHLLSGHAARERREPIGLPARLLFLVTRSLLCLVADTHALLPASPLSDPCWVLQGSFCVAICYFAAAKDCLTEVLRVGLHSQRRRDIFIFFAVHGGSQGSPANLILALQSHLFANTLI